MHVGGGGDKNSDQLEIYLLKLIVLSEEEITEFNRSSEKDLHLIYKKKHDKAFDINIEPVFALWKFPQNCTQKKKEETRLTLEIMVPIEAIQIKGIVEKIV